MFCFAKITAKSHNTAITPEWHTNAHCAPCWDMESTNCERGLDGHVHSKNDPPDAIVPHQTVPAQENGSVPQMPYKHM